MNWINILKLLLPIVDQVLTAVKHHAEAPSPTTSGAGIMEIDPHDIADQLHAAANKIKLGII